MCRDRCSDRYQDASILLGVFGIFFAGLLRVGGCLAVIAQ
jgi:hypothetical protein